MPANRFCYMPLITNQLFYIKNSIKSLPTVIYRIFKSLTFIFILSAFFLVSLHSHFVSIPESYQQAYTPKKFLDISFKSKCDDFKTVPARISFSDSHGNKKKYYFKDYEFSSGNIFTKTNLTLPLPDEISSLEFEFKSAKGSILIEDLSISGTPIQLNTNNVRVNIPSDKYSMSGNTLSLTSPSESPFILDSVSFSIKPELIRSDIVKYRLNTDNIALKSYYRCVNYLSKHNNTLKIPLLLVILSLFLRSRKELSIKIGCFSCAFVYAYTLLLFDDAQMLFGGFFNAKEYLQPFYKIFYSQSKVLATILLLMLLSVSLNGFKALPLRCFHYLLLICALLLTCAVAADIFTYSQFATHLVISDIFTFTKDAYKSIGLISDFILHKSLVAFLCAFMILSPFLIMRTCNKTNIVSDKKNYLCFVATAAVTVGLFFIPEAGRTLKDGNFVSIFNSSSASFNIRKQYSADYNYKSDHLDTLTIKGLNNRKNIIFLMVESLSSNESRYLGGEFDNTPNLDKLAKEEGLVFENYFTNGYNTDTGNFSFLTGIPYLESNRSYTDDRYYSKTIIKDFNSAGYTTNVFYSAQNIGHLDTVWKKSGFTNFYDGNDDFYANSERLLFNSVPDGVMFDNLVRYVPSWIKQGRFFTMVMTTTSHGPYVVPVTHEFDYHKTIRYVDKAIFDLYQKLKAIGFFDNGMLVISGDHRAMTPYSEYEYSCFGNSGIAKVPLIIIDKDLKVNKLKYPLSHSQSGALLEYLNLEKVEYYDFNYIPNLESDSYTNCLGLIFYQKHSPADSVVIVDGLNDNGSLREYIMTINGDDTDIKADVLSEERKRFILERTYWLRQ